VICTVYVADPPASALAEDAVRAMVKPGVGGVPTFIVAATRCVVPPLVPLIVKVTGPAGVFAGTATLTVEVCPALIVPPAGAKEHARFAVEGLKFVQVRVIEPENVPIAAAFTVKFAVWPGKTFCDGAGTVMLKSAAG